MEKEEKRLKVNEAIVVEGKYDKIKLSSIIDGFIVVLDGFGIYNDKEKLSLLRSLAKTRGLIILTDSDSAGFRLRHYLSSAIDPQYIKNVYIPEISGKEKRKSHKGKEGLLGVEGMNTQTILEAFHHSGVLCEGNSNRPAPITKLDLYDLGLSGGSGSATKRRALTEKLGLPSKLSANSLLEVLSSFYTLEELRKITEEL